jgi:hypothetical protein
MLLALISNESTQKQVGAAGLGSLPKLIQLLSFLRLKCRRAVAAKAKLQKAQAAAGTAGPVHTEAEEAAQWRQQCGITRDVVLLVGSLVRYVSVNTNEDETEVGFEVVRCGAALPRELLEDLLTELAGLSSMLGQWQLTRKEGGSGGLTSADGLLEAFDKWDKLGCAHVSAQLLLAIAAAMRSVTLDSRHHRSLGAMQAVKTLISFTTITKVQLGSGGADRVVAWCSVQANAANALAALAAPISKPNDTSAVGTECRGQLLDHLQRRKVQGTKGKGGGGIADWLLPLLRVTLRLQKKGFCNIARQTMPAALESTAEAAGEATASENGSSGDSDGLPNAVSVVTKTMSPSVVLLLGEEVLAACATLLKQFSADRTGRLQLSGLPGAGAVEGASGDTDSESESGSELALNRLMDGRLFAGVLLKLCDVSATTDGISNNEDAAGKDGEIEMEPKWKQCMRRRVSAACAAVVHFCSDSATSSVVQRAVWADTAPEVSRVYASRGVEGLSMGEDSSLEILAKLYGAVLDVAGVHDASRIKTWMLEVQYRIVRAVTALVRYEGIAAAVLQATDGQLMLTMQKQLQTLAERPREKKASTFEFEGVILTSKSNAPANPSVSKTDVFELLCAVLGGTAQKVTDTINKFDEDVDGDRTEISGIIHVMIATVLPKELMHATCAHVREVISGIKAVRAIYAAKEVDRMQRWADYATDGVTDRAAALEATHDGEDNGDEEALQEQLELGLWALCKAIPTQVGWQYCAGREEAELAAGGAATAAAANDSSKQAQRPPILTNAEPLSAAGGALVQLLVSALEVLHQDVEETPSPDSSTLSADAAAEANAVSPKVGDRAALALDCLLGLCDLDFRGTGGTQPTVIGIGADSVTSSGHNADKLLPQAKLVELQSVACVQELLSGATIRACLRFGRLARVRPKLIAMLSALSAQRASAPLFAKEAGGQGFILLINSCRHTDDPQIRFLATKGVRNLSRHGAPVRAALHKRGAVTALIKACSASSALDIPDLIGSMENGCGALANLALETGGKGADDHSARPREEMASSGVLFRALRGALLGQEKWATRQEKQLKHEREDEQEERHAALSRLEDVIACATRAIANLCLLDAKARAFLAEQHVAQPLVQICAASVGKGGGIRTSGGAAHVHCELVVQGAADALRNLGRDHVGRKAVAAAGGEKPLCGLIGAGVAHGSGAGGRHDWGFKVRGRATAAVANLALEGVSRAILLQCGLARSLAALARATAPEARDTHVFVAACLRNLCKHSPRFGREYVLEGGVKALAAMSVR